MHPTVLKNFREIISRLKPEGRILEIGSTPNNQSLLAIPSICACERVGLNIQKFANPSFAGFTVLEGNGNDMTMFADGEFDCVLTNATLEHDSRFWLTVSEIRRVLRTGGLAVIGVPGFTEDGDITNLGAAGHFPKKDGNDYQHGTLTLKYHGHPFDFYRFSRLAVRQIFFEGFRDVTVKSVMIPPRILGYGYKK